MICERIKILREGAQLTQLGLSQKLGVTRSCVNAWEMGISVPSTQYVVELARIFHVSTDYLLGLDSSATISTKGLDEHDIQILYAMTEHLRHKNQNL